MGTYLRENVHNTSALNSSSLHGFIEFLNFGLIWVEFSVKLNFSWILGFFVQSDISEFSVKLTLRWISLIAPCKFSYCLTVKRASDEYFFAGYLFTTSEASIQECTENLK